MSIHGSSAVADTQPGSANNVADLLAAAAIRIEPQGRWTQGAEKRNESGEDIDEVDPDHEYGGADTTPVCWCTAGAIWAERGSVGLKADAVDFLAKTLGLPDRWAIPDWNDSPERTQAEVVAALRAAAEKARTASAVGTSGASEPKVSS